MHFWVARGSALRLFWRLEGVLGGFESRTVKLGADPEMVVVDWNRDGVLDVIGSGAFLSVLYGTHGGALQDAVEIASYSHARNLLVTDADSDGFPDLALRSDPGHVVTLLINDGRGGVRDRVAHQTPLQFVSALATADFDGDGQQDLVAACYATTSGVVFLNRTK